MVRMRLGAPFAPKRNLPAIPGNAGMHRHAEQELERTVNVAGARFNEALKTNGVPVMLWRRTEEGRICSCQTREARLENDRIEQPSNAAPASKTIRVRSSRDLSAQEDYPQDKVLGVPIGVRDEDDGDRTDFKALEDDVVENAQFLDQDALRTILGGGNTTTCGICFGTGYTNGYALYGGQRVALDAYTLKSANGFSISEDEESDGPLAYIGETGGELVWEFAVPIFFRASWLTVRNNVVRARGVTLLINEQPVPLDTLDSFKGQTVKISVLAEDHAVGVTHVEIVLQTNAWPYTQIDQLQDDTASDQRESVQTLDFPFSPNIQTLKAKDCFFDFKYGKIWRITNVTDNKTAAGQIISWSVSATSRTSFDVLSLLKVTHYPDYDLSYRNLEL